MFISINEYRKSNDKKTSLSSEKYNIQESAFHDESEYAITLANENGFQFSIDQKNNAQYVYTLPVNIGNISTVTYKLLRIPGSFQQWRINCEVVFNDTIKQPGKLKKSLFCISSLCDFTVNISQ